MAEELPIKLTLQGIDTIIAGLAKLGGNAEASISKISESTAEATSILDDYVAAINRAAAARSKLNQASAGKGGDPINSGGINTTAEVRLPEEGALNMAGKWWAWFTKGLEGFADSSDLNAIGAKIAAQFGQPLGDIPEQTEQVRESIRATATDGVRGFTQMGNAAQSFAAALTQASSGAAISAFRELSEGALNVAQSFGIAGAAAVKFGGVVGGIVAAIGAVLGSQYLLADKSAEMILSMDELGRSAGMTAEEVYKLKEAYSSLGADMAKFEMFMKNISVRMLGDWPNISRQVRDGATKASNDLLALADAYRNLDSVKREGALLDENTRDAERGVAQARRETEEAQTAELRATIAYQGALANEIRADMQVVAAKRAVAAASRDRVGAELALEEALKKQRTAAFGAAEAEIALKNAKLGADGAELNQANAQLEYDKMKYRKWRERNYGRRDRKREQSFARRAQENSDTAIEQNLDRAKLATKSADINEKKETINYYAAPNRDQLKADLAVADAKDRVASAKDAEKLAPLNLDQAKRDALTAELDVGTAIRSLDASTEKLPAAIDNLAKAASALAAQVQNAQAQADREQAAQNRITTAANTAEDNSKKNIKDIAASLKASPEDRKKGGYIDIASADSSAVIDALVYNASPDGVTKPTNEQVQMEMARTLQANYGKDPAVRAQIESSFGMKGAGFSGFFNAMERAGPAGIQAEIDAVPVRESSKYDQRAVDRSLDFRREKSAIGTRIDQALLTMGEAATPGAIGSMQNAGNVAQIVESLTDSNTALGGTVAVIGKINDAYNRLLETISRGIGNPEGKYSPDTVFTRQEPTPGGGGFAKGGVVRGPGTGSSDSIPANLSNGEYVIRANAVEHWGVGMMDAINNFASGGLVRDELRRTNQIAGNENRRATAPLAAANRFVGNELRMANAPFAAANRLVGDEMRKARAPFAEARRMVAEENRMAMAPISEAFQSIGAENRMATQPIRDSFKRTSDANKYSLDIRSDHGNFTAQVDADTMKAITKSAMGAKLKSSGTKPSWFT